MSVTKELKTTTKLVKAILENDEKARNSDNILYLKVLGAVCDKKQIDIVNLTVPSLLLLGRDLGLPCFETVRRTRQKIQAEFPELSANRDVKAYREANEAAYREFARGVTNG